MKRKILLSFALFVGLFLSAQSAFSQGTVAPMHGQVTSQNGRGISGAVVKVTPTGYCFGDTAHSVFTNAFGNFNFSAIHTDCELIITVTAKQYTFQPRFIGIGNAGEGYDHEDFVAD